MNIAKRKGFTLIEILITVALIGILSAIVLATFSTLRTKARDTRRISDVKQLKGAIENYFSACYRYPDSLSDLETSSGSCLDYRAVFVSVPSDPLAVDHPGYSYYTDASGGPTEMGKRFHVCATLEADAGRNEAKAGKAPFDSGDQCDGTDPRVADAVGGVY